MITEGECGDPTAYPFYNAECHRPNVTDFISDFCPYVSENLSTVEQMQAHKDVANAIQRWRGSANAHQTVDSSMNETTSLRPEEGHSTYPFDVVVAKATNECWGFYDCFMLLSASSLFETMGLVLALLCISLSIIYL